MYHTQVGAASFLLRAVCDYFLDLTSMWLLLSSELYVSTFWENEKNIYFVLLHLLNINKDFWF